MTIDKPNFTRCQKVGLNLGVFDPVPNASSFEEAVVCALIQMRNLLTKVAYSVAPTISRSFITQIGNSDFERIYTADEDRIVEIQNISNLTDKPNDLLIQASIIKVDKTKIDPKKVGLVVRPDERIRLHIPSGTAVYAKFLEEGSLVAISELLF